MYTKIQVWGHWNDDDEPFCATVAVANQPLTAEQMEQALDDEQVFYVFNHGEPVLGQHFEFTITQKEVC